MKINIFKNYQLIQNIKYSNIDNSNNSVTNDNNSRIFRKVNRLFK